MMGTARGRSVGGRRCALAVETSDGRCCGVGAARLSDSTAATIHRTNLGIAAAARGVDVRVL